MNERYHHWTTADQILYEDGVIGRTAATQAWQGVCVCSTGMSVSDTAVLLGYLKIAVSLLGWETSTNIWLETVLRSEIANRRLTCKETISFSLDLYT